MHEVVEKMEEWTKEWKIEHITWKSFSKLSIDHARYLYWIKNTNISMQFKLLLLLCDLWKVLSSRSSVTGHPPTETQDFHCLKITVRVAMMGCLGNIAWSLWKVPWVFWTDWILDSFKAINRVQYTSGLKLSQASSLARDEFTEDTLPQQCWHTASRQACIRADLTHQGSRQAHIVHVL